MKPWQYLVANCLHVMTSWSLWPINITRIWSYFQVAVQVIQKSLCIWMDLYGNWGVRLAPAVNCAKTVQNTFAKWLYVTRGPMYQMSLKLLFCCQICCRYYKGHLSWLIFLLIPWTLDDLKLFSQQMCSILYHHNLKLNLVPPQNSLWDPFKHKHL